MVATKRNKSLLKWFLGIILSVFVASAVQGMIKPDMTQSGKKGKPRNIRPLIDEIYSKLNGVNLFVYPEEVNKIVNLTDEEIRLAVDYWDSRYRYESGLSLYGFINKEFDGGHYNGALNKLESLGYN